MKTTCFLAVLILAISGCTSTPSSSSEPTARAVPAASTASGDSVAGSASTEEMPSTIIKTMKAISSKLKQLKEQSKQSENNAESAKLADDMAALMAHGKTQKSQHLEKQKDPEAKRREFEKGLDKSAASAKDIAAALRANDNAKAQALIKKLEDERNHAHKALGVKFPR